MKTAALVCCSIALVHPVTASEPLSMRVSPAVAMAPAFVRVEATVERHADNRALVIVAESADFYSSSQIPLDGTNSARIQTVDFPHLSGGLYQITGTLIGAEGRRASTVRLVKIAPGLGSGR